MKKVEEWTIAYRHRQGDQLLIDDRESPFKTIPNTWRYWCADPHLLEWDGDTYVFAELYDRVLRRGVIGCCQITDDGPTPWKVVLKTPSHLSYPHTFLSNGTVYMIPESYTAAEIAVYKAVSFPDKWEKVHTLASGYTAVDTTLFSVDGASWLMTLRFDEAHTYLEVHRLEKDRPLSSPLVAKLDDADSRPAGNLFRYGGKLIRPAQDCNGSYGKALNFYHVTNVSSDRYEETLLAKIGPEHIRSDLGGIPQGIHTYNVSDGYEIIDLKEYKIDLWAYLTRPVWFLWRRIKNLFRR